MKRSLLALVLLTTLISALWLTHARAQTAPALDAPTPAEAAQTKFIPVDVLLDTGGKTLGSYQFEVTAKNATIVSLEGGEPPAFRAAPYYDPAALQGAGGRLVVAAFSTAEILPTGISRIARLHVAVTGPGDGLSNLTSKLVVATDPNGQPLIATLQLRPMSAATPTTQGELR